MNIAQSAAELTATNACCEPLKVPPGVEVVKTGKTSVSVDITISAASPARAPSTRKVCSRCAIPPSSTQIPTTPVQMIITAA